MGKSDEKGDDQPECWISSQLFVCSIDQVIVFGFAFAVSLTRASIFSADISLGRALYAIAALLAKPVEIIFRTDAFTSPFWIGIWSLGIDAN